VNQLSAKRLTNGMAIISAVESLYISAIGPLRWIIASNTDLSSSCLHKNLYI
jgi:hypothetical protein